HSRRSSSLTMNSSLLGQNTHHWKEQAAYMFAKVSRSKNSPERRDLEKRKMRRMKTKNRADDVPLAAAGDYPILGDARSILAPYSPTANDESFLDRLLWENAARTDAGDLSLADRTASRTCRLPGLSQCSGTRLLVVLRVSSLATTPPTTPPRPLPWSNL
ncbi:hypothetical protein PMAYCL1PPCAC_13135, partial [Pristionchus mayeri]